MSRLGVAVTTLAFDSGRCRGFLEVSSSDELLASESLGTMDLPRRVLGPGDGLLLAILLGAAETIFGFSSFPLPLARNLEVGL